MADVTTPLRQFTDAVNAPDPDIGRKRKNVDLKGQNLKMFSTRLSKTATVVAYANAKNKRRSDSLQILRYSHHASKNVIFYAALRRDLGPFFDGAGIPWYSQDPHLSDPLICGGLEDPIQEPRRPSRLPFA